MQSPSTTSAAVAENFRPGKPEGESGAHSCFRGAAFYVSPEDQAREERIVKAFRAGKRWAKPRRPSISPAEQCNPMQDMTPEEILEEVKQMRARGWKIHPGRYLDFITHGAE